MRLRLIRRCRLVVMIIGRLAWRLGVRLRLQRLRLIWRRQRARLLDLQRRRLRDFLVRTFVVDRQPARGNARPRLHPLACIREYRLGVGRRKLALLRSRRRLALQRADGAFERQSQTAQHLRRGALAVADDRRQHDGTVDLAAASTARSGCGRFEDPTHVGCHGEFDIRRMRMRRQRGELRRNFPRELLDVDVTRRQHQDRVGVVAQRQQHVLEGHLRVPVCTRVVRRPRQRRRETGRHGDTAQAVGDHEQASPVWRAAARARKSRRARSGWIAHFGRFCSE